MQGECGHEQLMRVAPHVHMYGSASVCYKLCRAGSPLVHLALRDGSTAVLSSCQGSEEEI
jgi:hypothetical protein